MGDSVQRVRGTVRRAVAAPPVAVAQSRHTPPPQCAGRRLANAVVPLAALAWFPVLAPPCAVCMRPFGVRPSASQSYSTLVVSSVSCIVEVAGGSDSTT